MRRSVLISSLGAATLMLGMGALGAGPQRFELSPQQNRRLRK